MADISGTSGDDTLNGAADPDTIDGGAGNDVLDGGADNDILYGDYNSGDTDSPGGNDQLTGGAGTDFLAGGRGNDLLDGGDGNDTLVTGLGLNGLWYDDGSFSFVYSPSMDGGDDTLAGGAGEDWAYLFYNRAAAITLDNSHPDAVNTIFSGGVAASSITGVEKITFHGGAGDDVVTAGDGQDMLHGGGGNDTLVAGGGDDFLYGGSGALGTEAPDSNDRLDGGAGTDTIDYFSAATGVTVSLALQGTAQDTGGAGVDTLISIERLFGSHFADTLSGDAGANDLDGAVGNDTLRGNGGDDYLSGLAGDDRLEGGAGHDILFGWVGADVMIGGAGDDSYQVFDAADVVTEAAGGGTDLVWSSISYALTDHVENLILTESAAINGTGNTLANSLTGNDAANVLDGGDGHDVLRGNGGNDTLIGGLGHDTFHVDSAADVVVELAGEGFDIVYAWTSYALAAGVYVEGLQATEPTNNAAINLTGNELAQTIRGHDGANVLKGSGGNDSLFGNAGNDQLIGGTWTDASDGGLGDDWHFVDSAADIVIERAGQGTDVVYATVSYTLAANAEVERLSTATQAATDALNLNGNDIANVIVGNAGTNTLRGYGGNDWLAGLAGNDQLDGGAGADTTVGGLGNDLHFVDNAADVVSELDGEGTDTVYAAVSYALGANAFVEVLQTGSAGGIAAINLTGNAAAQVITGNLGANVLNGGGGNDVLYGLGGSDSFAFTTALGAGNIDKIVDFSVADDTIVLENAVFTGLAAGALATGAFNTGAAATQADDRIVYNGSTGALLFDADGSGAGAAVQFATIAGGLALSASDFVVV